MLHGKAKKNNSGISDQIKSRELVLHVVTPSYIPAPHMYTQEFPEVIP